MTAPAVRIRGMYATALTQLCRTEGLDVTEPSPVIRERVDGGFADRVPNVNVRDTDDRAGVEIAGEEAAVAAVAAVLGAVTRDTFCWERGLPRGGIYAGVVDRTGESGAIVTTPDGEGFLPYSKVEGYVDDGDRVTVQVIDPEPPWSQGRRAVLSTEIRVPGTYVSLVRDTRATIVSAPDDALGRMVEQLGEDPPEDWGIAIHQRARPVETARVTDELARLTEAVADLDAALDDAGDADEPQMIHRPMGTTWCRFGREARFALDEQRGELTPTIDGHHRLKAIGREAGTAVDLMEAYGLTDVAFDADVVRTTFGPDVDDRLRIEHGKPSGEVIQLGRGRVTAVDEGGTVTIERTLSGHGSYDALAAEKEDGDRAETTFVEGRWWYPTVYRASDGSYKGTYVNVGTPLEVLPDRVRYVDLYVDVVRSADGEVRIVDRDELADAVDDEQVTAPLAKKATSVAEAVERAF